MPRGPSKYLRRRKRGPAPAAREPAPIAPPPAALGWCEQHECEVPPGSEEHAGCVVRARSAESRADRRANVSVYFDEAAGRPRRRMPTHMEGFDRVLGGGFVMDAMYLISGEKGAGKSTWLLQVCGWWLAQNFKVLYVSAEENTSQVGERAKRLGVHWGGRVLHTTDFAEFEAELDRLAGTDDDPDLIIVDSAQTIGDKSGASVGTVGSVAQSLHVAQQLAEIAKGEERCVILVGQETKEGQAAGSQQMPHLVDVILELHKNEHGERSLTDPKNRFGIADEVLVLDMTAQGLVEIGNVTEEHLARRLGDVGIVPFAAASDRPRPVLLAVTASAPLITEDLSMRRVESVGYPMERLRRVLMRLQLDCGCYTLDRAISVYVPQVLGEQVDDKAIDLAVAVALLSALHSLPPPRALVFGEVGIDGHVEGDKRAASRLAAGRDHKLLSFKDAVIPQWVTGVDGVKLKRIAHIRDLMPALWGVNIAMPRPPREEKPDALAA